MYLSSQIFPSVKNDFENFKLQIVMEDIQNIFTLNMEITFN